MHRTCLVCSDPINTLRSDAKFCSARCRVSHSRSKRLPAELTTRDRWVRRDARKRPLRASDGRFASSVDCGSWSTHQEARKSPYGVGLGFVLGDGIGCWDLDHCIAGGVLEPWAAELIASIENPILVERSQSGEGVHVFVHAAEGPGRKIRDGRCIEFYSTGRYIAVTGDRLEV